MIRKNKNTVEPVPAWEGKNSRVKYYTLRNCNFLFGWWNLLVFLKIFFRSFTLNLRTHGQRFLYGNLKKINKEIR